MQHNTEERISQRAYEIWDAEGRPHGRHHEHWLQAERELGSDGAGSASEAVPDPHPGMMGDGTEEQNLNQAGTAGARITEAEVQEAFGGKAAK